MHECRHLLPSKSLSLCRMLSVLYRGQVTTFAQSSPPRPARPPEPNQHPAAQQAGRSHPTHPPRQAAGQPRPRRRGRKPRAATTSKDLPPNLRSQISKVSQVSQVSTFSIVVAMSRLTHARCVTQNCSAVALITEVHGCCFAAISWSSVLGCCSHR